MANPIGQRKIQMNVRRYFQDGGRRIFELKSVVVRHNNTWLWKITWRVILFYKILMQTFKKHSFLGDDIIFGNQTEAGIRCRTNRKPERTGRF